MGFNKLAARAAKNERERPKQRDSSDGFVPTTDKELKEIHKRARARDEAKELGKRVKRESPRRDKERGTPRGTMEIKNALLSNQPIKVYRPQLFSRFVEICKDRDMAPPAYREYEDRKKADATFLYDIQVCCAKMPWQRLSELLSLGTGKPMPTRDWAEAFHCALWMMHSAFGNRQDFLDKHKNHVLDRIEDLDALEEWPVAAHKRRSTKRNTEDEELDMTLERRNASMRASARDDEDDEDEDEENTKKGRDEDEDEDDEDEKPRKKKAAKKASKPAKKSSRKDDDEDDEDDKPARKKRSSKDEDDDEDEKPARRGGGAVKLEPSTVLKKGSKKRTKSGAKQKLYELVPAKGIKLKALLEACDEEDISVSKAKKWLPSMVKKGYLAVA